MRKIEHVHTHALLVEVTRYLIENEAMSGETLSAYDALEARPTSIHKPKEYHHEAIMVLSSTIESCFTETRIDSLEQSVNP
jgi:hypothetical protein